MISSVEENKAPKEILRLALLQSYLEWEDINTNIKNFNRKLETLEDIDLVLLPEMFSTGFTMYPAPFTEAKLSI